MNTLGDSVNQQAVSDEEAAGTHEDVEISNRDLPEWAEGVMKPSEARHEKDLRLTPETYRLGDAANTLRAIASQLSMGESARIASTWELAAAATAQAQKIEALLSDDQYYSRSQINLREFDDGDRHGWAGTEGPLGFQPQIAEIRVEGLPAKRTRLQGRPFTLFFRPEGTLIVDANGITINFFDRDDEGEVFVIHKPVKDFSLGVEVAKTLRPTMKFNVLLALGFEVGQ